MSNEHVITKDMIESKKILRFIMKIEDLLRIGLEKLNNIDEDDLKLKMILSDLLKEDKIVFASPMYISNINGILKNLLDSSEEENAKEKKRHHKKSVN